MQQHLLLNMYAAMLDALGPSHWWPGETPFEVAVGAILTQNTNWANVEKAMANLKAGGPLTPRRLLDLPRTELAELIRPAGYYKLKADRLGNFLSFLSRESRHPGLLEGGDLSHLANGNDPSTIRAKLLEVKGVGPETADSILLYALELPVFVVDAYTHRILNRHMLVAEDADYHELQELFTAALPPDPALFNEYHALMVRVGKQWCRKKTAQCQGCPLEAFLE